MGLSTTCELIMNLRQKSYGARPQASLWKRWQKGETERDDKGEKEEERTKSVGT